MNDISYKYKKMERQFGEDEGLNVNLMEYNIGLFYRYLENLVSCMGSHTAYRSWRVSIVDVDQSE